VFLDEETKVEVKYVLSDMKLLQSILENRIQEYDGVWSVYVKNLKTDESIVIHDQAMKSASVMKLFVLGTVYQAIEDGVLERTEEVVRLMNNMISASDNDSTNQLLYKLGDSSYARGIEKVNAFIQSHGFSDMTIEYNGFNDANTVMDSEHYNQITAKDCGDLLEDIYRRVWVNRAASMEIETMMLNQQTRYKIPAGLPDGVLCGNKTGEMDTTENDAAIVYSPNCDYILVVLSSDWSSKDQAISRIASISQTVYEFFNE
jgi:beta-lactamase class A